MKEEMEEQFLVVFVCLTTLSADWRKFNKISETLHFSRVRPFKFLKIKSEDYHKAEKKITFRNRISKE